LKCISVISRQLFLKGHSLRRRWVRLLQPMARLPHGMAARCGDDDDVIACKNATALR
jgi:hypothetical protein